MVKQNSKRNCVNGTGTHSEGVAHGRKDVRCEHPQTVIKLLHQHSDTVKFRVATLNVGTIRGRSAEIVETLSRRSIDFCCIQEHRWRGASVRKIVGKDSIYKFFWVGNSDGFGGVGVLLAEKWIEKIIDVKRVNSRIMVIKILVGQTVLAVVSTYAPQQGLEDSVKNKFYDDLLAATSKFNARELVIIAGDLNGHVGKASDGYEGIHGGRGFGNRNTEGERILEFCDATGMVVTNTMFCKRDSRLITYQSGDNNSQIDFILVRKNSMRFVKDVKVIPGEEVASQHRLVTCDLNLKALREVKNPFIPRHKIWKLKEVEARKDFSADVVHSLQYRQKGNSVDDKWKCLKECLLGATDRVCGKTKGPARRSETWWWNDKVSVAIKEKRRLWKVWRSGGSKEDYINAKRKARSEVYAARKLAEEKRFSNILRRDDEKQALFKIAKKMSQSNVDVVGEKCVRNDYGTLAFTDTAKKEAWRSHYNRLLNEEFAWDKEHLTIADAISGPAVKIERETVIKAIGKMKSGKATGPTGIVIDMLKASGDVCIDLVTELINDIIADGVIPQDWQVSYIINRYKGKGDAVERGNYRGLKLLDHIMKLLERIIEQLIRGHVKIDEMQFGFMPGKSTTEAIFMVRQLQEKYLAKHKKLYFAFVDLEKAFDRVPRDVIWWAMRKLGVEEWIVRVVQAMYANARSRVRVNGTFSDDFEVKVGVHQGSVLSPLLFVMVLEALSREFRTGCPWELLYADDLVLIAESMEELSEKFETWKQGMESKGLRVNTKKTKIMISKRDYLPLRQSGKYPCSVCCKGVGINSIFCKFCKHWVHKKCSGVRGKLGAVEDYKCRICTGEVTHLDKQPTESLTIENDNLDVVDKFCYLGDMISAGGGAEESILTRIRCGWKKFRELLPVLTSKGFSLLSKGSFYQACIRSVIIYAGETWAVREEDLSKLERNDMMMIRWMCNVTLKERISSDELRARLGLVSIRECIRRQRLRWFGHVERMDDGCCVKKCRDIIVEGHISRGRPRKTWDQVVKCDLRAKNIQADLAQDRLEWRKAIK